METLEQKVERLRLEAKALENGNRDEWWKARQRFLHAQADLVRVVGLRQAVELCRG